MDLFSRVAELERRVAALEAGAEKPAPSKTGVTSEDVAKRPVTKK